MVISGERGRGELHGWAFLDGVSDEDAERLLDLAHPRRYERRQILFHEGELGDSMHLIRRGRVAVRVTTDRGDVATVGVLGPGDVCGELALLGREARRTASIETLEPTETLVLPRREFLQLRAEHPAMDRFFVEALARLVQRLNAQLLEALYVPVDTRVLRRLVDLARMYVDDGPPIEVPLTQEDIAGIAGTSRATVNRVLGKLEEKGQVQLRRGRVLVLDPAAIAERAH